MGYKDNDPRYMSTMGPFHDRMKVAEAEQARMKCENDAAHRALRDMKPDGITGNAWFPMIENLIQLEQKNIHLEKRIEKLERGIVKAIKLLRESNHIDARATLLMLKVKEDG